MLTRQRGKENRRYWKSTRLRAGAISCALLLFGIAFAWSPTAASAESSGEVLLGHGGQCLDVPYQNASNGQDLWMWDCNDTVAQHWTFSEGQLTVMGKCLDIEGPSRDEGALAQIWDCGDLPQHQWQMGRNGSIISSYSGLCLDVQWASKQRRAAVQLWKCNGSSAQTWKFVSGSTFKVSEPKPFGPVEDPDKKAERLERLSLEASTKAREESIRRACPDDLIWTLDFQGGAHYSCAPSALEGEQMFPADPAADLQSKTAGDFFMQGTLCVGGVAVVLAEQAIELYGVTKGEQPGAIQEYGIDSWLVDLCDTNNPRQPSKPFPVCKEWGTKTGFLGLGTKWNTVWSDGSANWTGPVGERCPEGSTAWDYGADVRLHVYHAGTKLGEPLPE